METILVVEDELEIARLVRDYLERAGFEVVVAGAAGAAVSAARARRPDLVVLDLGLPGMDGLEVARRLRADGHTVPILILTARADEVDTVVGLDAGADDYVTKPFRLAELLARVRALLRRGGSEGDRAPAVRIDQQGRRAFLDDKELQLTAKEFDLLRVLVRDAGRVVTRDQLMREVWDTTWWSSTKTLDMHISWLRKKLGDDAANPRYIATVRGVGFRFEKS